MFLYVSLAGSAEQPDATMGRSIRCQLHRQSLGAGLLEEVPSETPRKAWSLNGRLLRSVLCQGGLLAPTVHCKSLKGCFSIVFFYCFSYVRAEHEIK